jgi:hypothetical protein
MTLPTILTPEFETTIPSNDVKIKFRPFLVKEEKILYMAQEGGDSSEIAEAMQKILQSCIVTPNIDVSKLASFDIEYLFLKLRAKSVSENIELTVKHKDADKSGCQASTDVEINIDDINVIFKSEHNMVIDLGDNIGLVMKYPDMSLIIKSEKIKGELEKIFFLMSSCVVSAYDSESVYEDFTPEEIGTFIENLSKSQFEKVSNFFNTMPKLKHEFEFTCKECDKTEKVVLEGSQSFFI